MDIQGKLIWQQAAGDKDRNYVDVCLENDVILNGPGYLGPLNERTIEALRRDGWSPKKIRNLLAFRDEMKVGDLVVLKLGTDEVHGVGEIAGDYLWSSLFGDVDGWDIEHVRPVRWLWKSGKTPMKFPTNTLKWGDTTQKLISRPVLNWLESLQPIPNKVPLRQVIAQEHAPQQLSIEKVAEHMFDMGVASSAIQRFMDEVDDLVRIYGWYQKKKEHRPTEHETVAYLVVPFLRALGWTPQKMAVEWRKIDVALFSDLPRTDKNLACVVEVKNLGSACLSARLQAEAYVNKWGPECSRFVVTDGLRYGIYEKEGAEFRLRAYMNLNRRYDEYPIYGCKGMRAGIMALTPEKVSAPGIYDVVVEREDED